MRKIKVVTGSNDTNEATQVKFLLGMFDLIETATNMRVARYKTYRCMWSMQTVFEVEVRYV